MTDELINQITSSLVFRDENVNKDSFKAVLTGLIQEMYFQIKMNCNYDVEKFINSELEIVLYNSLFFAPRDFDDNAVTLKRFLLKLATEFKNLLPRRR